MKKLLVIALFAGSVFSSPMSSIAAENAQTVITQNNLATYTTYAPVNLEVMHPTAVECEPYVAPTSQLAESYGGRNCTFAIQYQFTSSGTDFNFFAPGQVVDEAGNKIGEFAGILMMSDKYGLNKWTKGTATARVKASGKMFLSLEPFYNKTYDVRLQTPIYATVISQLEADQRKAAKEAAEAKAAANELAAEKRALAAKKLSIVCNSGSKKKVVKGDPPKCPAGYSFGGNSYLTYKTFAQCKLYKKDSSYSGASLSDGARTLEIEGYGKGFMIGHLSDGDFNCALSTLKVSSAVRNKIFSTRAIDGQVSARVGNMSAYWTYHPDSGLNISFTYLKL